ncbi:DUF7507 domain-containing protein [Shivajiella indica]|uniref:Gliding motility-associated C-terminal domain-containing protein n=1 Tax=Shivajiella indica TaxID=872115 RepID=A0ABW5BCL8_9BACT
MKGFHLSDGLANTAGKIRINTIFKFILFFIFLGNKVQAQNSIIVNGTQNNIPIQEVTLIVDRNGPNEQRIVQNTPGLPNPLPENGRAEVESILLGNGERIFATNRFPVVKTANPGLGTNVTPNAIRVIKYNHTNSNEYISHSNLSQFLEAIQEVVSTPDLRSYWDIGSTPIFSEDSAFLDIIYPNQIPQSGYLMISERNGNSALDLLPLDIDGNVIEGSTRVELRVQFDWNTGVNHQVDATNQKQWLTVFTPDLFGTEEPIYGFRVFDIGESDGKIIFFAREISAAPDNSGPIFGFFGGNNVLNIFDNDELDGKVLDPSEINLTIFDIDGAIAEGVLIIDQDPNSPNFGSVSVRPGTPAGIYTFEYEIEDKLDGRKDRAVVTIRVVDPVDSDFPDCRDQDFECQSGDLVFENVFLSDALGNPIQDTDLSCEIGTTREVYLALSLVSNSPTTLFETRFFADLSLGNLSLPVNAFLGTIEPSQDPQTRILTNAFIWSCGDAIKLNDILVTWLTEEPEPNEIIENCEPYEPQNSQCLTELLVSTPLSLDFSWVACSNGEEFSFDFTSIVGGGTSINNESVSSISYAYAWDFNNDGNIDSEVANPSYVYENSSATQVKLTVNDGTGNSITKIKNIVYPSQILINGEISDPTTGLSDGGVVLEISGGTGDYIVNWFKDGQLISSENNLTNISSGIYVVVVKDENGCEATTEFNVGSLNLIIANVDNIGVFTSEGGLSPINALDNDTYNGGPATTSNVQISIVTPDPFEVLTLDVNNGNIFVSPGAEPGTYELVYQISDLENPSNISTATITVIIDDAFLLTGVEINKTASTESYDTVGEVITYTITVTNIGTTTLVDLEVTDPLTGFEEKIDSLEPGTENSVSFTTNYIISQEDLDNGEVINTASVVMGDLKRSATEIITAIQNPSIEFEKTADKTIVTEAGEVIVYTLTVTNTGNVTLFDLRKLDQMVNYDVNIGSLSPGESRSVDISYVVTQADMDRGTIENLATVSGKGRSGEDTSGEDIVVVGVDQIAQLEIVKSSSSPDFTEIGQEIVYTITVSNNGNVTLTNILVSDPLTGFETLIDTLAPGVSVSYETIYIVVLEDIERGSIVNIVTVTSTDPNGEEVNGEDSITIGGGSNEIIANDDNLGDYDFNFTGILGNILDNDLLEGQRPDPADVDFEFTELDGIVGLEINENGELTLTIPGVNEAREYTLRYVLRETLNPTNSDDAIVTFRLLNPDVDISVSKTSNDIEVFEGDEFEYVITVSNIGETDASEVVVTDELPAGVSYISSSFVSTSNEVELTTTIQGNNIIWNIPFLPADAVVTITLRVKANPLTGENPLSITNNVTVVSSEDEVNPGDNSDTDVNIIQPFFIPNVITPNSDGRNDTFEIKGLNKFVSNEIVILNRYGDTVFQRSNYNNDWDAPGQGAGTYFYVLTGVDAQGRTHDFKGWIQVIR